MLQEIQHLAAGGRDFGFETTLSGRTHLALVRELEQRGYAAHLFFLWHPSAELALARIRGRVLEGGHDIPSPVVRRRFERSMSNFFHHRSAVQSWILFDNSGQTPKVIAEMRGRKLSIIQKDRYARMEARSGNGQ